jgi:hypothetical protein
MLCFVEAKTDDLNEIELPGVVINIRMKNRFKSSKVKLGENNSCIK